MPNSKVTNSGQTSPKRTIKETAKSIIGYFEVLDAKAKPLPAYTATIMERCFAVFLALWLAFQGAYLHNPALMSAKGWFAAFILTSGALFLFSERLSRNIPKASIIMQFSAILLIGFALIQGEQLGLLASTHLWLMPAITLIPALYLAIKRNLEIFAFAGYATALVIPVLAGIPSINSSLFFGYYFLLCLPLPLVTLFRHWRYLNICVFGWIFTAGSYYLATVYNFAVFDRTQMFFMLFFGCYFLVLWARMAKAPFTVFNFLDFIFGIGLAIGAAICQLRIAMLHQSGVLLSVMGMSFVFATVAILGRLSWGEHGRTLSRIYLFVAAVMLNSSIALFASPTVALGIYCLQATLLFWLGSAADMMRVKAGGFIILMFTPAFFFFSAQHMLAGAAFIALASLCCAYVQDRELKRLAMRSGKKPWSSGLEFFLVVYGFGWCFFGLAAFTFKDMPYPGLVYFALSSACAYIFFALGRIFRLRSLRVAIFIPMLFSIPAALLPFIYQIVIEWPDFSHLASYNYLSGLGALAWVSYFITVWTALYHNWGGLISNRTHARFLALVTLELVLVLTSSCRAFALDFGVSPSLLSTLAVLPSLICVLVLSRIMKTRTVEQPYRRPMLLFVPWMLFLALAGWFVSALSSPGSAAPGGNYIPLLNPVEFVQLVAIVTFGYWQRCLEKYEVPAPHLSSGAMLWVYGVSSFLWLHGVMFRVVRYFSQAEAHEVMDFVELRIIFACIWIVYGILAWLGSTMFVSVLSWLAGALLFVGGSTWLVYMAAGIWGQFVAVVLTIVAVIILTLLIWRSPMPFTQRCRKLAGHAY